MVSGARVALMGGDGRCPPRFEGIAAKDMFQGARFGGNGEARRLESALRSGGIRKLVILARWNGHSATRHIRKVARAHGVEVVVVP
jgi:hypothetical protein